MGRDVARAVRHGCRLAALAEAGERAERGAGVPGVRVVDGDREPLVDGGDGGRPGSVPGEADLGPQPLLGRQGPPPGEPLGLRTGEGLPEPLGAVFSYEHTPRDAGGVHLGHLHGHVVQPLVGEQQPGDPLRGLGQPLDARIESSGTVGELDCERTHACGHFGGQRGEYTGRQLTAAGGQVHEVQGGRLAEGLVHPAQQPGHGAREERRRVHGRTEVSGWSLGPAVEALGPVQGVLGRRPPATPPARGVFRHVVRLSAQDNRASTLGSTRDVYGSVLRLTPAHFTRPYAGLRAAPL